MKLFDKLFHPCKHEWKFVEKHLAVNVTASDYFTMGTMVHTYKCEKCGKIKKERYWADCGL